MNCQRVFGLLLVIGLLLWSGVSTAQELDQYGGYRNLRAPAGATRFFRVEKIGNRWMFVTPEGHPFWMVGVFAVDPTGSIDDLGDSYQNRILRKYPSMETWGRQTVQRLKAWGFNTVAEYASAYVLPQSTGTEKLPYVVLDRPSWYGLTNRGGYAPGPFKDLIDCQDPNVYTGYSAGRLPDIYDPNFPAYVKGRHEAGLHDPFWGAVLTSPWKVGLAVDDADDLLGFGPGPDLPAPVIHPHPGWLAIAASPTKTASSKHRVTYADPKVYTKYALRDFLRAKYGTIGTLNAAWKSTYASWESAGGYGAGNGVLDENGRHIAWLGGSDGTLKGASPAVVADLDAFLYEFAKRYFSTVVSLAKRTFPDHLVFGPATLNGWGGLSRRPILKAAGEELDVLQAGIKTQEALDLTVRYAGDRPIVTWEGALANPDSSLWRYRTPFGVVAFNSQAERGQHYAQRLNFLLTARTATGSMPIAGLKYWQFVDNWAEKANWGLVSFLDNAYDGKEATVPRGKDPWEHRTGGEEHNYGDFISVVRQANKAVLARLHYELTVSASLLGNEYQQPQGK